MKRMEQAMKYNLTPDFLDELTPDEVAELEPAYLAHLQAELAKDKAAYDKRAARLHDGLVIRYGEAMKSELAPKAGTGTAHIDDNGTDVTVTVPKTVEWDQDALMTVLASMPDEDANHYAKYKVEVEERKFKAAPPAIQGELTAARTVKAGKPKFEFKSTAEAEAA